MKEGILPIWQPVGYSTHIIAKKVAEKFDVLTSHTGVIDPMAEGVVIILLGEDRNKKYEYASWVKEYEFEVLFGLETDTYDGMGIVDCSKKSSVIKEAELRSILSSFVGDYVQKYPPYSAKIVNGKPLHWYSRNKKLDEIEIPSKEGNIFKVELLDFGAIPLEVAVRNIIERIKLVSGDFRQEEIIKCWNDCDFSNNYQVAKIRVSMSKGLYVRGLAVDIASALGSNGFVYSLVRTGNGDYTRENSKTLEDVFGSDFLDNYDFTSRSES